MHAESGQAVVGTEAFRQSGARLSLRLRGAMIAVPCWAILVTACSLTPQASGYGTHEQLGLPTCSFLARTGLPCPTCGVTTSVAAMAHGRLAAALHAQPFGVLLFAAVAFLAVVGTTESVTGWDILSIPRPSVWWALAGLAGMLACWGAKLAIGFVRGELPIR